MKVVFSTGRPAHVALPANLLMQRGVEVTIYTAAYRSRFHDLASGAQLRWAPQLVPSIHFLTGVQLPRPYQRVDTAIYDNLVAVRMGLANERCEVFWGWASGALAAGRAARHRGASFVLDRACPHVDAQQALVRMECDRLGVPYQAEPHWFRARQIAEYEEADTILVPSDYSRRSFPLDLRAKVIVAPLYGRVSARHLIERGKTAGAANIAHTKECFTFGTVGGQPLRKGFLYLLQAWEKLRLPNARLLIRTDADPHRFPALRELLRRLPNVEIVGYLADMSAFYRRCDAFVLPTIDDGFGMALLEAMAHGLPSIATTHCGATELFQPGHDLLRVPPQDSIALAEAVERIYTSAELREQLRMNAMNALRRIEGKGSYERYSQALDMILADAKTRRA
ncbi:MAG: glycosyltransferase family 4 protein [Acidobacteriaceae bacterium]